MTRTTAARPARTRTRARKKAEPRWKNNLLAARRKAGKSQIEVANHIGRKQNLISAIERGDRSGREYMDEIAEFLRVSDPSAIFPYYDYYTFEEAAELMGVSSTLIARRVDDGEIPAELIGAPEGVETDRSVRREKRAALRAQRKAGRITDEQYERRMAPYRGGQDLIPKSALRDLELRKRPSKSMRATLRDVLAENPSGVTSRQLLASFGPFEAEADEKRTLSSVQQILARFPEFGKANGVDPDSGLVLWALTDV